MSETTSAATGRCFGIQRVCQVWERSRSALYARRARAHHRVGAGPARRGPQCRLTSTNGVHPHMRSSISLRTIER